MAETQNAIVVETLRKHFFIRHFGYSIKGALMGGVKRMGKGKSVEELHALKGISFTVPHGQTLAVIGWNGSGKSTLLGILARVYKPTSGVATLSKIGRAHV